MSTRKWAEKRISVSFTKLEVEKLEAFCTKHQLGITEVIRELVRNLKVED